MRKTLFAGLLALGLAALTAPADAEGVRRIYDPETHQFVTYGEMTVAPSKPKKAKGKAKPAAVAAAPVRIVRSMKSPIKRELIAYSGPYKADTILVDTKERRLYYVLGQGKAVKYGVGVGREGFQWAGTHRVTRKAEWPGWTPPAAMRKRQPYLPAYMEGGPRNPLGARAMYIGSTLYRIHGSNEPWTIGTAVSSGCIRMTNEDVVDLYNRVKVGTKVVVKR